MRCAPSRALLNVSRKKEFSPEYTRHTISSSGAPSGTAPFRTARSLAAAGSGVTTTAETPAGNGTAKASGSKLSAAIGVPSTEKVITGDPPAVSPARVHV